MKSTQLVLLIISLTLPVFSLNAVQVLGTSNTETWQYSTPTVDPNIADNTYNTSWYTPGYNKSSWSSGWGLMGYGTIDGGSKDTTLTTPASGDRYTAYFAIDINGGATGYENLMMNIIADDAAYIYLNGSFIDSINTSGADTYNGFSAGNGSESVLSQALSQNFTAGINHLAISVHQTNNTSSDLGLQVSITGDAIAVPEPSTYAAITGLFALAVIFMRRRKR